LKIGFENLKSEKVLRLFFSRKFVRTNFFEIGTKKRFRESIEAKAFGMAK